MRRILLILLLCLLATISTGCKKARLRSQLKELMNSTIVLPEKIICVEDGEIFPMPDSIRYIAKLVVFVDSSECTTCRISHIGKYRQIFRLSEEIGSFGVVLLFPSVVLSGIPVERYVMDSDVGYPIYFDIENKFLKLNPSVAADHRLHSFLIDDKGTPLCVGDPSASREMLHVFWGAVNNITNFKN